MMEGIDFFKLIVNNAVSIVIAYMLLKFFIEIMRKKLLGDSEIEKQNLQKNIEIFNSLTNLNNKFNGSQKNVDNCFGKTVKVLDKISTNQEKLCTLMESIDRRINGQKK